MSIGVGREIFSGLRRGGGSVPAEGAGCGAWRRFAAGEEGEGFWGGGGVASREEGVGVFCQVWGGGEESGMGGHAAEDAGVFVLDFALDDFLAEGAAGGLLACA